VRHKGAARSIGCRPLKCKSIIDDLRLHANIATIVAAGNQGLSLSDTQPQRR
jgi:hypothetical protein